jgi:hypothetical protein
MAFVVIATHRTIFVHFGILDQLFTSLTRRPWTKVHTSSNTIWANVTVIIKFNGTAGAADIFVFVSMHAHFGLRVKSQIRLNEFLTSSLIIEVGKNLFARSGSIRADFAWIIGHSRAAMRLDV